ncbi:hypothetical protein AB0F43_10160 [Kribbella sp. NPDC023972]|uniref:hypothetical protein n=1 Tax=Kribbella sp. NPDC023972 TaxID=3154795 RepID=UPI0033ED1467
MTEPNDFSTAGPDEPLVDDLLDETRRPEDPPANHSADAPAEEKKQQPDPPATPDVPEAPD